MPTLPADQNVHTKTILSLQGITKRYGAVTANDQISIDIQTHSIHALLGENGAGKSTLVSVLYGLVQPDDGEIVYDENPIWIQHPQDAIKRGIALVQQHFSLIEDFTVLENLMLGQETTHPFGIDQSEARKIFQDLSDKYSLDLPLDKRVGDLPVGIQQRVEIAKALSRNPRIILFDEPTAALVTHEIESFLQTMNHLRNEDMAVVFITHRMDEVMQCADEVTVLRQGKTVLQQKKDDLQENEIAAAIVGDILHEEQYELPKQGKCVLQINQLNAKGNPPLRNVSLELNKHEILGIAAIAGNGQDTFVKTVIGLSKIKSGSIELNQQPIHTLPVHKRKQAGISLIPQDRKQHALLSSFSVWENHLLHQSSESNKSFFLHHSGLKKRTDKLIQEYGIKTQSNNQTVSNLSGGHQQRIVISGELSSTPKLIIAHDPTRGLDIRASQFVHEQLLFACQQGAATILFSSELSELFLLCHRIAVLKQGLITEIRPAKDWTSETLGYAMAGGGS